MDCVFCKIINGQIPSYTIYEDDFIKAFLDIDPASNGHTLVIPKNHIKDIDDMDELTFAYILSCTKIIKKLVEERFSPIGFTLVQNNGEAQDVKHFHLHVIPKYKDENVLLSLDEVYEKLK